MSDFLNALRAHALLADGAMGSLLFQRTGRLSEPNHVYESFNSDRPELVRDIHLAYLAADARCLKTNTFGAHGDALDAHVLGSRIVEPNHAGMLLARQAIASFQSQCSTSDPLYVLASVGPTQPTEVSRAGVERCYRL